MASLKRTHKADLNIRWKKILGRCAIAEWNCTTCSLRPLAKLSAGGELQLESRALAQRRLHPEAANEETSRGEGEPELFLAELVVDIIVGVQLNIMLDSLVRSCPPARKDGVSINISVLDNHAVA